MASGPQHFKMAEELLQGVRERLTSKKYEDVPFEVMKFDIEQALGMAAVHAQLAEVALRCDIQGPEILRYNNAWGVNTEMEE